MLDEILEQSFQEWYANYASLTGNNANPDDPGHFYDYRGAFLAGEQASPDPHDIDQATGRTLLHMTDQFKMPGHPNMFWAANDLAREGLSVRPEAALGLNNRRFDSLLDMQ